MFAPQVEWICDGSGRILVDLVLRFETLRSDFADLCKRLCVNPELPHLKASVNRDYRQHYDADAADVVAIHFEDDLEEFGYSFDRDQAPGG